MTFTPHIQPSQNDEDCSGATLSWPWLNGQHELGRRQGGVAGEMGWRAGWRGVPGGMAGQVGRLALSGGGPDRVAGLIGWRAR